MQQAYRILRVVAETQTIRMTLTLTPGKLVLQELCLACTALAQEGSSGIKVAVLDFQDSADVQNTDNEVVSEGDMRQAAQAVQALRLPVLAVVRGPVSLAASELIHAADLTLVAHHATLVILGASDNTQDTLTGVEALRMGLVSWSVAAREIDVELERILGMLRNKSAVALRLTKESVRLGTAHASHGQTEGTTTQLDVLQKINEFYLAHVMQTADAVEGLHAFLEKRQPRWKNQ